MPQLDQPDSARWGAVVPAAGQGLRLGACRPKQYLDLGRRPVLIHTLSALAACPRIETMIVVAPPGDVSEVIKLIGRFGVGKISLVVPGGETRQESVRQGLMALDPIYDYVLIHDGVRPLVDQGTIERVMDAARETGAATAGVPARDTLAEVDKKSFITSLPERSKVWQVQTPQGFWRPVLTKAQDRAEADGHLGTDEAGLVVRLGRAVRIVEGSPLNLKITTAQDLKMARALLGRPEDLG